MWNRISIVRGGLRQAFSGRGGDGVVSAQPETATLQNKLKLTLTMKLVL